MAIAAARRSLLKVGVGPNALASARGALGPPPPGRPVSNIGRYLLQPTAEVNSGFEMINGDPEVMQKVNKEYLKAGQLPPALQPKYLRKPAALDTMRAKAISRGWRNPKSHQG